MVPLAKIAARKATNAPLLQVNSAFLAEEMVLITLVVLQLLL